MASELSFGQWLKQRRKTLDLTQNELARRVHCSVVTIQKIEAGQRRPSRQIAELLATHLDIPTEQRAAFLRAARQERTPADDTAPTPSLLVEVTHTNLPAPLTPLLGRQAELAAVHASLAQTDVRLVTLVGPAGVGKTRLSIAIAQTILDEELPPTPDIPGPKIQNPKFKDGVWFISLAALTNSEHVAPTIAHTLGIRESGDQPMPVRLQQELRHRQILLVLDNFEQVVAAAVQLVELLVACPHIKALVTSRVPLQVRGERETQVAPLELPDLEKPLPALADLRRYPAVALFEAHVRSFQPAFELNMANARGITEICTLLDGLPLAIELAAARLRQFTVENLLSHLRRPAVGSLGLLTEGARDLPLRHQTLRNAIAWSYDMLAPATQRCFDQLGVFIGGFDYQAAAAIVRTSSERQDGQHGDDYVSAKHDLGIQLQTLVEQNLLQRYEVDGATRFVMLETIHSFAGERLAISGDEAALRTRHADYFLSLTTAAARAMQGTEQKRWLDHLEREHNNLRSALRWLLERDDEKAAYLASALCEFWYIRGYLDEGRNWLAQTLARQRELTPIRARMLLGAGQLAQNQGDAHVAAQLLEESLAIYRALGDTYGMAEAAREYGWTQYNLHNRQRGLSFFEESLRLSRAAANQHGMAHALIALAHLLGKEMQSLTQAQACLQEATALLRALQQTDGLAYALQRQGEMAVYAGDYETAVSRYQEALLLFQELGLKREIAWSYELLGEAELLRRNLPTAYSHLAGAMPIFEAVGDRDGVMITLHHLGQLARFEGNFDQAHSLYLGSLTVARQMENRHMVARCLAGLGGVALGQGQFEYAARLLGAAYKLFDTLSPFLAQGDREEYDQCIAATRAALGDALFQEQWEVGQAGENERNQAYDHNDSLLPDT